MPLPYTETIYQIRVICLVTEKQSILVFSKFQLLLDTKESTSLEIYSACKNK